MAAVSNPRSSSSLAPRAAHTVRSGVARSTCTIASAVTRRGSSAAERRGPCTAGIGRSAPPRRGVGVPARLTCASAVGAIGATGPRRQSTRQARAEADGDCRTPEPDRRRRARSRLHGSPRTLRLGARTRPRAGSGSRRPIPNRRHGSRSRPSPPGCRGRAGRAPRGLSRAYVYRRGPAGSSRARGISAHARRAVHQGRALRRRPVPFAAEPCSSAAACIGTCSVGPCCASRGAFVTPVSAVPVPAPVSHLVP